jgi:hypothetical protein
MSSCAWLQLVGGLLVLGLVDLRLGLHPHALRVGVARLLLELARD